MGLLEVGNRAIDQLSRIISAFGQIWSYIFWHTDEGWAKMIINTIMTNNYLLVSVSLLFCGFVIGLISRMIRS